jgi:hypothetical protein
MSILKGKPDAGQGGKRGHSNQDHWEFTEEIKLAAKKRRRHQAKRDTSEGLKEYQSRKREIELKNDRLTSDL